MIRHTKTLLLTAMLTAVMGMAGCQSTMDKGTVHKATVHKNTNQSTSATGQAMSQQVSPEALSRYSWKLVNAVDSNNQPLTALTSIKDQVELSFGQHDGQNLTLFSVGCNNICAQYSLNNNVLNISNARQTMMGCGELSGAETLLGSLMQGSSQLVIKGSDMPILTQITSNHATLVWQGTLTPQAKYDQQGDTVYWQIDHQSQPCADGSNKTCLKVRPISYDAQGFKSDVGQWGLFAGTIQGYTHDDQNDEILRLQRFVVNPSDVKGKQYAYVLDTVVESSVAQ